jgi:hypothetical protein
MKANEEQKKVRELQATQTSKINKEKWKSYKKRALC